MANEISEVANEISEVANEISEVANEISEVQSKLTFMNYIKCGYFGSIKNAFELCYISVDLP